MKKIIRVLFLILVQSLDLSAGEDKDGDYGFLSVFLTSDSRSYSLGNLVAAGNDWNSYYWNPALIGHKRGFGVNYEYDDLYQDMDFQTWTFGYGHTRFGSMALFYRKLDLGKIEITTIDQPDGTEEYYSPYDAIYGICYARTINQITAGITVKRLYSNIGNVSASAYTMDLGAITRRSVKLINRDKISEEVTVAFSASNSLVSKKPKYSPSRLMIIDSTETKYVNIPGEPFRIPESFHAGGTYTVTFSSDEQYLGSDQSVSVTINAAYQNTPVGPKNYFCIGLECVFLECLRISTVTANLANNTDEKLIGSRFGAGLTLSSKRLLRTAFDSELRIQYAEVRAHGRKLASPIIAGAEYRF